MRSLLILIICLFAFNSKAMPSDTITVWHLDYNGVKYLEIFPHNLLPEVTISKDTLSKESTLSIRHAAGCIWNDDTWVNFAIVDQNEALVDYVSGVYSQKSLSLKLAKLLVYHEKTGERIFDLYYCYDRDITKGLANHMVRITLLD